MITLAAHDDKRPFRQRRLLHGMIVAYTVLWGVCAFSPWHRSDWLLENLLVFISVPLIVYEFTRRPLSDLSYVFIFTFFCLHAVGAHYTYAEVPLGAWLQGELGLGRNHYDRVVHFSFGLLLAYPVREVTLRYARAGIGLSGFIAFTVIAASSAVYEVIEMLAAMTVSPETAFAYLGVQGDVFDAQKDTALAIVGCIFALMLSRRHFRRGNADVATGAMR